MTKRYMLITLLFVLTLTVSACGGGGSSGSTVPTTPNQTPTPDPVVAPTALEPEYTGARSDYVIDDVNIGETVVSTLSALDFLNQIVFENDFNNSLFIEIGSASTYTAQNLVCESGSSATNANEQTSEVKVDYNNCVIGSDTLDGFTQSFVDDSAKTTLNIDLTILSGTDDSSITLKGNIVVTALGNLLYNLTIDDGDDIIWFDNLFARVDLIGLRLYFQGDIYLASNGKLSIATNSIEFNSVVGRYEFDVDITGDSTLSVNVVQSSLLTITAANLVIPLTQDLTNFTGLPEANLAPIAQLQVGEFGTYNTPITIDGSLSRDANLQILSFTWSLLDDVDGNSDASVDIQTQGPVASIIADRPGDYKIRVVIADPFGASDEQIVTLTFAQKPPQAIVSLGSNAVNYGALLSGSVQISSPEFDGPFEYSLEYAPEGMALDANGELSWRVDLPNLGQALLVNTGVRVTTPSHSRVFETQVMASPVESLKRIPVNTVLDSNYKFALGTSNPVLLTNRVPFEIILNNGQLDLAPHILPNSVASFAHGILHIADIDEDNDLDYFVTEFDPTNGQHSLWSIDESGNRKLFRNITPAENEVFDLEIKIMDITDSPGLEILLFNRNFGDYFEVLSNQGEVISSQGPPARPWCDINADGKVDWIADFEYRYRLFDDSESINLISDLFLVPTSPRYLGLQSTCNIYAIRMNELGEVTEIVSVDPINNKTISIADVASLASQFGISNYNNVALRVINLDADANEELIINFLSGTEQTMLVADNLGSENQQITKLDTSNANMNSSEFAFQSKTFDVDGDGIDEIIALIGEQFSSTRAIGLSKIDSGVLTQFSGDVGYGIGSLEISYWDAHTANIGFSSSEALAIQVSENDASQTLVSNLNFGALVTQELMQDLVYETRRTDDNEAFIVEKRSLNGSSIWEQTVASQDTGYLDYTVGEVDSEHIILKGLQPIIVERAGGEIAYRFPAGFRSITMNNGEHLITTGSGEKYLVAYNDTSLHAVQLLATGEFVDYPFAGLNNLLQSDFDRASLVQLDATAGIEFVMHYGRFDAQKALSINFGEKRITELPQSINGSIGFPNNTVNLFSSCITNSKTCQNSIFGQYRELTLGYGNIFAVDAITRATVWQTQQPFVDLKRVAIAKDDDGFRSLMILGSSAIVLE